MTSVWNKYISEGEIAGLAKCHLAALDVVQVELGELRVQHRSEWDFDSFLKVHDEFGSRSILSSPFCEAACLLREKGGEWMLKNYRTTSYYELFRHFGKIGWAHDWASGKDVRVRFSNQMIKAKIIKLIKTYQSMESLGYRGAGFKDRSIIALIRPYESMRLGFRHDTRPFEIWSGHHRAACLGAIGVGKVSIVLAGDERHRSDG